MATAENAHKILANHEVDSFVGSCLGGAIGKLIDCGLSDIEIMEWWET